MLSCGEVPSSVAPAILQDSLNNPRRVNLRWNIRNSFDSSNPLEQAKRRPGALSILYRLPDSRMRASSRAGRLSTITPDWRPIVGKAPGIEGYYLAVGGSGHSFKIGPPIGEAQLIAHIGHRYSPLRYE